MRAAATGIATASDNTGTFRKAARSIAMSDRSSVPVLPGHARLGTAEIRIDGPAKVTGQAPYAGDMRLPGMAHAKLVRSPIARGRITAIGRAAVLALPGILDVLTFAEVGEAVRPVGHVMAGGWTNSTARPLASAEVRYGGQIVAVVVGETLETASAGAAALIVDYAAEPHVSRLEDAEAPPIPLGQLQETYEDRAVGNLEAALTAAAHVVDQRYTTPIQHHNPIELPSTICFWSGDDLTVWEPTRFVNAAQHGLAAQLGIEPEHVRVIAQTIGGHFGSKLALSQHTVLCALAAKRTGRPVHLEIGRRDAFTIANHRTETRHHIRLGADRDGRFVALGHDAETVTSQFDDFAMEGTDVSTGLYACSAIAATEQVVRVDRNTPGPMRAPPEVPFLFALESAVDEMAAALAIDPILLRRRNDTLVDPVTGHPFTTRLLMRCFDVGAEAFGWRAGPPRSHARREGDWLVGQGCAAAARPVKIAPARIRVTRTPDAALIETAHHEIGNGIATVLAMMASERLDLPIAAIEVRLGDTALPAAGLSGGSSTTTSLANALGQACTVLRGRLSGVAEIGFVPPGADVDALRKLDQGKMTLATPPAGKLAWAFGAHFVEVRVHASTCEIQVRRHVAAFAAGRILNPLTARSQLLGGMVWGHGSALLEETMVDPRTGTYVNEDLADYLVPTAADIGELTALTVVDEDREADGEGVKGLGEIGIIGANAAIANAVFDATGHRIRTLPIRIEALL